MDNQEYLSQIAATVRPEKKSRGGFLKSPLVIAGAIMIAVMIVIWIIFGVTNSGGGIKEQVTRLMLHFDDTAAVVDEYRADVKAASLRSSSATLYLTLNNTSRELTDYLASKYSLAKDKIEAGMVEEAKLQADALSADLFRAKANGVLDSVYAEKIAYEILLLMNEETKVYNNTGDEELKSLINTSYSSLKNLYDEFNDFSGSN